MNMFVEGIDPDTQILIAMGAAIASNCQPCLKKIVNLAKDSGLDLIQMQGAVAIGQFVKDQPMVHMKELADELLDTKLSDAAPSESCGCTS